MAELRETLTHIVITRDRGRTLELWPKAELEVREGTEDNTNETVKWIEYWMGDQLVHRSALLFLKQAGPIINPQDAKG